MRVYITPLVERASNEAFDLLNGVRIEEVVDEGLPRMWTLTWHDDMPRIERSPNDYCDVGYHLVGALINGDVSGLDPDDEFKLERFIEDYPDCVFTPDENEDGVIEAVIVK